MKPLLLLSRDGSGDNSGNGWCSSLFRVKDGGWDSEWWMEIRKVKRVATKSGSSIFFRAIILFLQILEGACFSLLLFDDRQQQIQSSASLNRQGF